MSESVFPYWKEFLKELVNHNSPHYNAILYSPIGTGKSTFVALLNLYVSCLVYLNAKSLKKLLNNLFNFNMQCFYCTIVRKSN